MVDRLVVILKNGWFAHINLYQKQLFTKLKRGIPGASRVMSETWQYLSE